MVFCKEFNVKIKDQNGMILLVVIMVFFDKSFMFIFKLFLVLVFFKKVVNIVSGLVKLNQDKVGKVIKKQFVEIWKIKKVDMNVKDEVVGIKVIVGIVCNMGIEVVD